MRMVKGEIYYKRNGSHCTICVKPSINQLKDVSPKCRIFQTDNWSTVVIKSFLWTYDTVRRGAHSKLSRKKVTDYNKKWYQHMAEKVPTSAEGNVLTLRDVEIYERVKQQTGDNNQEKACKKLLFCRSLDTSRPLCFERKLKDLCVSGTW